MAKSKTVKLKVVLPILVTVEGDGKLDLNQLKQSVIEHLSQDYVEDNFRDALLNDQDEFEGSIGFGAVTFKKK